MTYYQDHKEDRLIYQKNYNIINVDKYKTYHKEYFQKNKEHIMGKRKPYIKKEKKEQKVKKEKPMIPLPIYKLKLLERMLRNKLNDYYETVEQQKIAVDIVKNDNAQPLIGISVSNNKFKLVFD